LINRNDDYLYRLDAPSFSVMIGMIFSFLSNSMVLSNHENHSGSPITFLATFIALSSDCGSTLEMKIENWHEKKIISF